MKSVEQTKQEWADKLNKAAGKLDAAQKQQVAVNVGIAYRSFERYTCGKGIEMRRLELAEKILTAMKDIKETANA